MERGRERERERSTERSFCMSLSLLETCLKSAEIRLSRAARAERPKRRNILVSLTTIRVFG